MHTCSSDSESDVDKSPPRKKKVVRYEQKFINSWLNDEKFKKDNTYFYCSACDCDRKCGIQELTRHKNSSKHQANCKKIQKQPKLTSLFASTSKSQEPQQMAKAGEIKLACFIAEHNLAFNVASHLTNLIKSVCPDSKTAEYLSMSRTKARAIVVNVIGKTAEENLIKNLREKEFALLVDESTDKSAIKHLALIARLVNTNYEVGDKFLTVIPITNGSAKVLYQKTVEYFNEKEIPYKKNLLGFASDSANVMFGGNNSMITHLKNDIPNLFTMKCICHSFALCASHACENYCLYILSHPAQTRWLSLNDVVNRLLEQLPAIKLYFQSAVLTDRLLSGQSILTKAMEPTTELYLEFLRFALPIFTDLNKEMQAEKPKLHLLYDQIYTAYVTILECFIQPVYLDRTNRRRDKQSQRYLKCQRTKNIKC
ncbi:unnamed protein product [Diatraea saccharalis]|uniref:DUF4371 domain-containing protein n=1 Tax=Diatraea saccharalis TaxID=40085 RepID=A0A9N9RBK2_9NEOP|nr:unnamed protein product [Diatraea saccharalis]